MNKKYNTVVIGGGPAGMMAAGRSAERGASVVLVEKNDRLGAKLLITGKGRCNITNTEEDLNKFLSAFGKKGKFLRHSLKRFSNSKVVDFFNTHGCKTVAERGGRVFPESNRAQDVAAVLARYIKKQGVVVKCSSPVKSVITGTKEDHSKCIEKIVLHNKEEICAQNIIIATGGKSYPRTGSSGDAYLWLKKLGHTIVEPKPALTPIICKEPWVKKLEGLSLKNVEVSLWEKKRITSYFGEALFTGNGLSGPTVLNLSNAIGQNEKRVLKVRIDFKPALDHPTLDKRIQRDFLAQKNRQFKNCLHMLLPRKLIPVIVDLSGIDPDKRINEITRKERKHLVMLFKEFELSVKGLVGFEKAIITAGGVDLSEINPKTMQSKLVDNLYVAGEVLDLDGPTGGYNLQAAWSTGFAAGDAQQ